MKGPLLPNEGRCDVKRMFSICVLQFNIFRNQFEVEQRNVKRENEVGKVEFLKDLHYYITLN